MIRLSNALTIVSLLLLGGGCSLDSSVGELSDRPTGLVFGGPVMDSLLEPFQGGWEFKSRAIDPTPSGLQISGGADIAITGHIIRFGGRPLVGEFRLCQVTETEAGIKSDGWHHEDIHDPGDMERVECELQVKDNVLEFRWRMVADSGFRDDPVVAAADYRRPARPEKDVLMPWWIETYSKKNTH